MATASREEKLKLSADNHFIHGFRQGLFVKFYEQSLWCFVHSVRPLKPMREPVKGGTPAANLADPSRSEERLEAAERLRQARISLETARAFILLAWEMKFLSGAVMSDLDHRLEELAQQAARWRGWFGKR